MSQTQRVRLFNSFADSVQHLITEPTYNQITNTYCVREFKLKEIDASFAKHLYLSVVTKQRKLHKNMFQLGWIENQLRLFVWTLTMYAWSKKKDISELTDQQYSFDWSFFTLLFPNKKEILFIYQGKNVLKKHNQYKKWVYEQDRIFEALVRQDNYRLKWSQLGKSLFIESDQIYFRTPKQCRERWLNHLDPSKLKKCWHEKEDFLLIEYVKLFGKKWANISKKFHCKRNEHSIKNRFKSLLTKQSKQAPQCLNETELIDSLYLKMKINQPEKVQKLDIFSSLSEAQEDNDIFEMEQSQSFHRKSSKRPELMESHILKVNTIANNRLKKQQSETQKVKISNNGHLKDDGQKSTMCKKEDKQMVDTQKEKQIRADLFLQQDPFEMVKSYFYKKEI